MARLPSAVAAVSAVARGSSRALAPSCHRRYLASQGTGGLEPGAGEPRPDSLKGGAASWGRTVRAQVRVERGESLPQQHWTRLSGAARALIPPEWRRPPPPGMPWRGRGALALEGVEEEEESAQGWRSAAAMRHRASVALRGRMAGRTHPRCVAYCTAESFHWDALLKGLQKDLVPSIYFSEVIHVSVPDDAGVGEEGDVFFFRDGSVVLWDVSPARTQRLFADIEPFQVGPYDPAQVKETYSEAIDFTYGKEAGLLPTGELVLSYGQSNWAKAQILEKIAFSHGMQRSVKISVIEDLSDRLIASIKQIPDMLTEKRSLKLDQDDVMRTMGRLLSLRGLINLHLPLNETPEAYWEEPWLEELYSKISRELDLGARIRDLNRKLDYSHQVVDIMRGELSERHHVRLEKIIIYLIAIELAFEILHFLV